MSYSKMSQSLRELINDDGELAKRLNNLKTIPTFEYEIGPYVTPFLWTFWRFGWAKRNVGLLYGTRRICSRLYWFNPMPF